MADYADGYAPSSIDAGKELLTYVRDTGVPRHRIRFNYLVDVPVGRGKRFLGNAPRWVDEILGPFQWAGNGTVFGQQFALGAGNFGTTSPLQIYKHKVPIQQCSTTTVLGVPTTRCLPGFQYFNGYVPANQNGSALNGVLGLPASYTPYSCPINTAIVLNGASTCGQSLRDMKATNPQFGTNNVNVTLANGSSITTAFNPGPGTNQYTKTILQGPFVFNMDMSIYKQFKITERFNLKVNLDAFNVFNNQGDPSPNGTTGIQLLSSSVNAARQLQASARISF